MIESLRLQQFRSYHDALVGFDPGVNIIVGPNASGKTNLLEAVLVVAHGSSYRAKDAELLDFGADWARLDAATDMGERTVKMQLDPRRQAVLKTFEIGDHELARLHATRQLPVVLFEPDHLLMLGGSPDLRRSFLDDLIEQMISEFGATRRHYRRVLAQRNTLLKHNPASLAQQLFVWNVRLSELGGKIARERHRLVTAFNERITELYCGIAVRDNAVELAYASRFTPEAYETELLKKLEASTELDVARGFTAYGPHRDDLAVLIDGRPAQETASRGETRTLVLALKMLELKMIEASRGQKPLLLLDDVFSELDAQRRQALTQFVQDYQTFITTTDADIVADYFASSHRVIRLPLPAA